MFHLKQTMQFPPRKNSDPQPRSKYGSCINEQTPCPILEEDHMPCPIFILPNILSSKCRTTLQASSETRARTCKQQTGKVGYSSKLPGNKAESRSMPVLEPFRVNHGRITHDVQSYFYALEPRREPLGQAGGSKSIVKVKPCDRKCCLWHCQAQRQNMPRHLFGKDSLRILGIASHI